MASSIATKIRAALIRFFQARLPHRKVSARSNVKRLCGYDNNAAGWRALARGINALPAFRQAGLRLPSARMDNLSTITEIERDLRELRSRVGRSPILGSIGTRKAARAKARPSRPRRIEGRMGGTIARISSSITDRFSFSKKRAVPKKTAAKKATAKKPAARKPSTPPVVSLDVV